MLILDAIGNFIAGLIPIPLLVFMVTYGTGSPWRADPLGIERMFQKGYLLLLSAVILAGNFLPAEFEMIRLVVRILVFGIVVTALSMQVVNLRRVQTGSDRPLFFTWFTYAAQRQRKLGKTK